MKIIICGSMSSHKKMSQIFEKLQKMGHIVEMPNSDHIDEELDKNGNSK